jgi:hypothetical protein
MMFSVGSTHRNQIVSPPTITPARNPDANTITVSMVTLSAFAAIAHAATFRPWKQTGRSA